MSGILFLNHNDFEVKKGDRGDMMTLKFDKHGLTLVLFYSKELPSCEHLMTRFKQLPGLINGCNFAMVNMNKNMELVGMSRNTIAPITYVPDLTLFVNGCPFIRYDGEQEIHAIRKFLQDIYEKIQKLQFTSNPAPTPPTPSPPPDHSSPGHPPRTPPPVVPAGGSGFPPPSSASASAYQQHPQPHYKQQFPSPGASPHDPSPGPHQFSQPASNAPPPIPAYTVGMPKTGDPKRSYKTFDTAYSIGGRASSSAM